MKKNEMAARHRFLLASVTHAPWRVG